MKNVDISRPLTILGYTQDQIRQMDVWFRSRNLSWQVLDEKYKQGFEAGVSAQRELIDQHLKELMKQSQGRG